MTSAELINQFVSGGLLGMAGQTIRMFVGLTKASSAQEEISIPRIVSSLVVGLSAGGIGIFTLTGWNSNYDLKPQDFSLLLSIGYAGTDFLEGFFKALVDRGGLTETFKQGELADKILDNSQKLDGLHEKVELLNQERTVNIAPALVANQDDPAAFTELTPLASNVVISFATNVNKTVITTFALDFLRDTLSRSGNMKATITSSARTPEEQARAMFTNIESKGVASQKALYANAGDQVIDVYVDLKNKGKSRQEIITAMTNKINEIGPSKVSRHCSDFTRLVVIDVAPSSIVRKDSWVDILEETKHTFVGFNFILPGNDPAYHLEIPNSIAGGDIA